MPLDWRLVATSEIDLLAHSISRMADGNLGASIPKVKPGLAPVAASLEDLKSNFAEQWSELSDERAVLDVALNSLPEAVLLFETTILTLSNRSAEKLFGIRKHQNGSDLTSLGLPASVESRIDAAIHSNEPTSVELGPDPLGRSLRINSVQVSHSGTRTTTLVTVADITERVRLDHMRKDFVAAASHELKTPVAGIALVAETALLALGDGDYETARSFIGTLHTEATNMQRLVGDLLDLSRYESGPSGSEICDVRAVIDNAIVSHSLSAQTKGIKLHIDVKALGDKDVYVRAPATDVAIVLDNLIDNAISYTDTGQVSVSARYTEDIVTLDVRDSGIGVASGEIDRIFERFYRVDASRSRTSGGTGLGLALVKHAIERNDGTIAVESTVGEGTCFTVSLPRAH